MHEARRNEVVAIAIFVDTVDMEEIERSLWTLACRAYGVKSVVDGEMIRGAPFENELASFDIDLPE